MGTHPIFESDFDCLTEKMFSPGGRPSLLGSLNRSGTNQDRSDSPISATSPYSNRFHGDTRMLGTATIPSITGNHYLNPNSERNRHKETKNKLMQALSEVEMKIDKVENDIRL